MTGAAEKYAESPTFPGFQSYAFSFFFAGRIRSASGRATSENIRLAAARANLMNANEGAYKELVQPTQSFFSDILSNEIPLQRRPLIIACEPEDDAASRRITLVRPAQFRYFAEGRDVVVENDGKELAFEYRDVFALFESGHVFYVLSLIPDGQAPTAVNEYHIIALQKLANPTEETQYLRDALTLRCPDGRTRTIPEFIDWRHAQLAASTDKTPNAVRDILRKLLSKDERLPAFGWDNLKSVLIALEDPGFFALALGDTQGPTPRPQQPARPHMPAGTSDEVARQLALAGIVQGVADFPFQDENEIEESVSPLVTQRAALVFAHPKFLIEVGPVWRSLTEMRRMIGSCPYVLLTHTVITYNQHILESVEYQLERLVYDVHKGDPVRASALGYLQKLVQGVEVGSFNKQKRMLKASLERRVEIYRDLVLSRLPNIFRYPRERDVFDRVSASYLLESRYNACLALLANYDALSGDVHELSRLITDRAMNTLLSVISAISVLGVLSVAADLAGAWGTRADYIDFVVVLLGAGLGVYALLRLALWALR